MQGKIHPDARASVISETPVSAVLDAHGGAGQLTAIFAMRKAIEKAKNTGIGFVTVSYTHLDVYKRQVYTFPEACVAQGQGGVTAVEILVDGFALLQTKERAVLPQDGSCVGNGAA